MTDLEITKLCAGAMGLSVREIVAEGPALWVGKPEYAFNPLHDDAQAMALVKRFGLHLSFEPEEGNEQQWLWIVEHHLDPKYGGISYYSSVDLNRAICECVAKLQQVKGK